MSLITTTKRRNRLTTTRTKTSISQYHIPRGEEEVLKIFVTKWEARFILKEEALIRNSPVALKDKDTITQKSGVINRYRYDRLECKKEYMGESARTSEEGLVKITGHQTNLNSFFIVGRESHNITRTIKEAIYLYITKW